MKHFKEIRDATVDDIDAVVKVHMEAFPGFFLTMLGSRFLSELYHAYISRDGGILRVCINEQETIVGFCGGCHNPEIFYYKLQKQKGIKFFIKLLPTFFRKPVLVLKKVLYSIFYRGEKPSQLSNATLLSSIGVDPAQSGKFVGQSLLADFEAQCLKVGNCNIYLTTDKLLNDRVISFYRKSGYLIDSEFKQSDGREMLRFVKKL
jgi:ribosomal protein S18 acetylase RimI-like enzyme